MKKFENIILASDIDGTLLWKYSGLNPKNTEKIRYFTENGGHFLISSGRNSKDIMVVSKELIDLVNTPCVLVNGGMLYDIEKDEIENPVYVDTEKLVELLSDVEEKFPDVGFRASHSGGFLARDYDEYIMNELKNFGVAGYATFCKLDDFRGYKLFKAIFRHTTERIAEVSEYVIPKYKDRFSFTRSSETILEVQPLGITKAYQLAYLKERMLKKYPDAKLWCVGDFDNDIDMLRFADFAACPENSSDEVKKICPIHLCHCKDGAVAELVDIIEKSL